MSSMDIVKGGKKTGSPISDKMLSIQDRKKSNVSNLEKILEKSVSSGSDEGLSSQSESNQFTRQVAKISEESEDSLPKETFSTENDALRKSNNSSINMDAQTPMPQGIMMRQRGSSIRNTSGTRQQFNDTSLTIGEINIQESPEKENEIPKKKIIKKKSRKFKKNLDIESSNFLDNISL